MKKTTKVIFAFILCALTLLSCACGTSSNGGAAASGIVGNWLLPDTTAEGTLEAYSFEADGSTFYLYQMSEEYVATKAIKGTYKIEGDQLTLTMMNFDLVYTYTLVDENTLKTEDHGTETIHTRITREIKRADNIQISG